MGGDYISVEPDGHLTTNINWGKTKLSRKYMPVWF
jgi:hypothetical protein